MKIDNRTVINKAQEIGFDLVGFAKAENLQPEIQKLKEWLANRYQAGMSYMERNVEKREDIKKIFPNAKSVISLAVNYFVDHNHSGNPANGKISRYAWGKDYHLIIEEMLNKLIISLKSIDENFEAKAYVDTGPVMDKAWAARSGIGWLGKHTNVISKKLGSWFFLATVITNYEFDSLIPSPDFCGTCTACIDACPTNAIVEPYLLDSNKCISYLTIENKGEISAQFKDQFDNWLFGCDVCQEVCPWNNKFALPALHDEFKPACADELNLKEVMEMNKEEFSSKFKASPVKRAGYKGLKRNASFLLKEK